ncbi:MAG: DUF4864 domain-containing protein [Pseudomonadota bacterium]|nr:DUF4864 domain-containing protein [Pseudomonadota bacterium]
MGRLIILITLLLLPMTAVGEDVVKPDAAVQAEIISVIEGQISAFRRDDAVAAFSFASPTIRAQFGDASTFLAMVAALYRPVYRPRQLEFLDLKSVDGQWVQRVLVMGPQGEFVMALYPMVRVDGRWRINGCFLVRPPGQGT